MATADVAKLIASLSLQDKGFTKGLSNAEKQLGKLESTSFRVGQHIGSGLKTGAANLAKLGAVAAGGITLAVKSGLDDLATLENAVTSVDGAIQQLGLTGQVTGAQISDWANQIEADVDAAFDDKAITQATATLIRYGKLAPKNIRPAMEIMTDLAAKTGDVESASELLAKSLVDPTKAAGKLAKAGVVLTKQQKDQIKAMTEAGDVAGAQAVLIDALSKSTAGAAKAMAGPYQDAINKTNDALEDAKKALAIGFLPVITKVADKLSKIAADPKALASIQAFGKTLAGGLDHLIGIAENLPWDAIGTSMQIAGMGAKAILDAFVSLPPWVQTAVLTGWGLNKLTGGALSGIVSELAKGAIKGVLGINAGVVQVNAKTVTGVGGAPGAVGGATSKISKVAAAVGKVFIVGAAAGAFLELAQVLADQSASNKALEEGLSEQTQKFTEGASLGELNKSLHNIDSNIHDLQYGDKALTPEGIAYALNIDGVRTSVEQQRQAIVDAIQRAKNDNADLLANLRGQSISNKDDTVAAIYKTTIAAEQNRQAAFAIRDKVATSGSLISGAVNAAKAAIDATKTAAAHAGQQTAAAIRDKDLSVDVRNTVNVSTSVSVKDTIGATHKVNKYTTIL